MTTVLLAAEAPPMPDMSLLDYLPSERKNRLSPSLPPERLSEVLTAYSLVAMGLKEQFGVSPEIAFTTGGRPYAVGCPGIHLSLSHTRGLAVCALSGSPVGVDAECVRPVSPALFARVCGSVPYDEGLFFREWTHREALFKLTGEGTLLNPGKLPDGTDFRHFERGRCVVCVCGGDLPWEITVI